MSGYPAETVTLRGNRLIQDTPLLPKPFRKAELARFVRGALDEGEEAQFQ